MEVVIAHPADPSSPFEGGGVRYAIELSKYLAKKRVDVTLVGTKFGDNPFNDVYPNFMPIASRRDSSWIFLLKLAFKIPFLKIPKSAIIHTCRLDFMLPFIMLSPNNPKIITSDAPLVYARLTYPSLIFKFIMLVYQATEAWCLKWKIDRLITDVSTAKEYYERRYPWLKAKLRIIPTSGVDLSKFRPMDKKQVRKKWGISGSKVVVFVGRLAKVKNIDFLIRSFVLVKQRIPDAKLIIVGKGESRLEVEQFVKKLKLDDVVFTGEIHPDKIPEILNCADVLALSSIVEGSPTAVREAIACGVPVVTTDVGDVRQVIKNNFVGSIVGMEERKFANALIRFLNLNERKRRKVVENCVEVARELSLESVFEKVLTVYSSLRIGNRA